MNSIEKHHREDFTLVILDIDETLIHATSKPKDDLWDFELKPYKVYLRPGLQEFLLELKEHLCNSNFRKDLSLRI